MSNRNLEEGLRRLLKQPGGPMELKATPHSWHEAPKAVALPDVAWQSLDRKLAAKAAALPVLALHSDPEEYLPNSILETLEEIAGAANDRLGSSKRDTW